VEDERAAAKIRREDPRSVMVRRGRNHWRHAGGLGIAAEMSGRYGSQGGRAFFAKLTPEQIREHQSRAAKAR